MFKVGDEGVDIGQIERRIIKELIARQRDRYKRLSYDELSSQLSIVDARTLAPLQEASKIYEVPMRTRRGLIGWGIAFAGRVCKRLLAPVIYRQQHFNTCVIQTFDTVHQLMADTICELKRDVEELRAERRLPSVESTPRETSE